MMGVAIIGAGFTGTAVAATLLRSVAGPMRIALIDRTGKFGRGVAYGTGCAEHVLNVPAGRMSALPEDPDHFLRWAHGREKAVAGGSFLPRMWYGEYLAALLEESERSARSGVALERIGDEAVGLEALGDGGARVALRSGRHVDARRVVLAVGNFAPAEPPGVEPSALGPAYVSDPWAAGALSEISPAAPILLIGTGLTMIDVVLELLARGHVGPVVAVSRRGLLPQPHRSPAVPHHPDPPAGLDRWPPTALGMLKAIRREVRGAAVRGIDWREVVTALRADTPRLWASLPEGEQRRFLRRLRPFWDTHRHRSAPGPAARVDAMIKSGRLRIVAGRAVGARREGNGLAIEVRPRGESGVTTIHAAQMINCTGPDTDLGRCRDPLIASARERGLIRPDPLGLGLLTTDDGVSIGSRGPEAWLSIAGPLRRAQLWENTAVPELRVEAASIAARLATELERPRFRVEARTEPAAERL